MAQDIYFMDRITFVYKNVLVLPSKKGLPQNEKIKTVNSVHDMNHPFCVWENVLSSILRGHNAEAFLFFVNKKGFNAFGFVINDCLSWHRMCSVYELRSVPLGSLHRIRQTVIFASLVFHLPGMNAFSEVWISKHLLCPFHCCQNVSFHLSVISCPAACMLALMGCCFSYQQ